MTFEAPANTSVVIGNYDPASTETQNISVEVTTDAGYYFDENDPAFDADVWTVTPNEDGTETATTSVELTNAPCASVTPVAITITPTVCTDGTAVVGTATYPTTEGVTYTSNYDPAVEGAQTATVTATLMDGYSWGDLSTSGYTATNASVATYSTTVVNIPCESVVVPPETPGITPPPSTPAPTTLPVTPGTPAMPGASATPAVSPTTAPASPTTAPVSPSDPTSTATTASVSGLPSTGAGPAEGITAMMLVATAGFVLVIAGGLRRRRNESVS